MFKKVLLTKWEVHIDKTKRLIKWIIAQRETHQKHHLRLEHFAHNTGNTSQF